MKAIFRVRREGKPTGQFVTLDVINMGEAITLAETLRKELKPVSKNEVEVFAVGEISNASSLFEAFELSMTSRELLTARTSTVSPRPYDEAHQRIG